MSSASNRNRRCSKRHDGGHGPTSHSCSRRHRTSPSPWPTTSRPFDVVMSRSVLHWVPERDHRAILEQCKRVLRPGGTLRIECGGGDNVREIVAFLDDVTASIAGARAVRAPWTFLHAGAYLDMLLDVGFDVSDGFVRTVAQRRVVRSRGRARLVAQPGDPGVREPGSIRTSAPASASPSTTASTSCAVRMEPTTSRLCASTSARTRECNCTEDEADAPTMRAMMPSVLLVSFFTTVAVTAGLLASDDDDDRIGASVLVAGRRGELDLWARDAQARADPRPSDRSTRRPRRCRSAGSPGTPASPHRPGACPPTRRTCRTRPA